MALGKCIYANVSEALSPTQTPLTLKHTPPHSCRIFTLPTSVLSSFRLSVCLSLSLSVPLLCIAILISAFTLSRFSFTCRLLLLCFSFLHFLAHPFILSPVPPLFISVLPRGLSLSWRCGICVFADLHIWATSRVFPHGRHSTYADALRNILYYLSGHLENLISR